AYNKFAGMLQPEDYSKELEEAAEYNEYLSQFDSLSAAAATEEKREDSPYESLLNVGGNGIMAVIKIPSIKVELPIYHGTSEGVLQVAVGHYLGSSLPIGGESTHAILTGHRGLPSAKLFTDLDRLETGDIFYIKVLGDILEYEIDQIETVLPSELDSLSITPGEDYVTLVTCTPYGINSHRMLVRGTRIPYDGKYEEEVKMKPVPKNTDLPESERGNGFTTKQWILFAAAVFAAAILAGLLLPGKKSGKKENGSEDEAAEGKKKKLSKNSRTEKKEGSHEKKE
ncbi:MAG: class C sortase, partial [Enterocloster sp.]